MSGDNVLKLHQDLINEQSYKINKRPKHDMSPMTANNEMKNDDKKQKQSKKKKKKKNEEEKEESKEESMPVCMQFPVEVFVRIRQLVGMEVTEKHKALEYSVKKLKKKKTQTLTVKKANNETKIQQETEQFEEQKSTNNNTNNRLNQFKNRKNMSMDRGKTYKGLKKILFPQCDNFAVFKTCIAPCISNIFAGNCKKICAFAYGHTGSGKTHTIFGYEPSHPGMFRLFARNICDRIKPIEDVFVEIRFSELYQGKIRDLLSSQQHPPEQFELREDDQGAFRLRATQNKKCEDGKIRAYPMTNVQVRTEQELFSVIHAGVKSRKCGSSTLHDKSSRSHAFLELELVSTELLNVRHKLIDVEADILDLSQVLPQTHRKIKGLRAEFEKIKDKISLLSNDENRKYVGGTMVFVDLAGNEYGRDVKNKNVEEEKERKQINQSLMALKECIRGLHNKKKHVPYRNHNLTKYLKQYLSGNGAKAIMISCIGSSQEYEKQTVNTLKYTVQMAQA